MRHTRLPGETDEYLAAREALRLSEIDLMRHREQVANQRRDLPPGPIMNDYVFLDTTSNKVSLRELFTGPDRPLVIYHLMYGKQQTTPCPMCTMWIDGFNGIANHLHPNLDFAVVAAAAPDELRAHATARNWTQLNVLSAGDSTFKYDLGSEDADGVQDSTISVLNQDKEGNVRHVYTTHPRMSEDIDQRGIDLLNPVWHLLDLTPKAEAIGSPASTTPKPPTVGRNSDPRLWITPAIDPISSLIDHDNATGKLSTGDRNYPHLHRSPLGTPPKIDRLEGKGRAVFHPIRIRPGHNPAKAQNGRAKARGSRVGVGRGLAAPPTYHRQVPLKALLDRIPAPPAAVQRGLAIAAVVTQIGVAVGGATVRVTGSGLGCPTWPECAPGSLVPIADPTRGQVHQWIEFGNRLLGAGVGIVGALVLIAALLAKPRRKRHLWLAAAMPLGVVAQAVIGGITVLVKLDWVAVCLHFLPSPILVWFAVLLVKCVSEGDEPARPVVPKPLRGLLVAMTVTLAALIGAGELVTAAGPHSGDINVPRLHLPIVDLAQFHSDFLFIFVGMLVAFGFAVRITGGSRPVWRAFWWLVVVVVAQGALGLTQYFLGVPEVLVIFHVLGAMLVTAAMAGLWVATRERDVHLGGAGRRSQSVGTSLANQP